MEIVRHQFPWTMAYIPIQIPDGTDPAIERLVRDQIDPQLRDVHAMLRIETRDDPASDDGCAYPIAQTLLAVLGGVAQELYLDRKERAGKKRITADEHRFNHLIAEHFPSADEPDTGERVVGTDLAGVLYGAYRCPLTHNLGMAWNHAVGGQVKLLKGRLTEAELERIERAAKRPAEFANPTLRLVETDGQKHYKLTLKHLYWCVRKVIVNVLVARTAPDSPRSVRPTRTDSVATSATDVYRIIDANQYVLPKLSK